MRVAGGMRLARKWRCFSDENEGFDLFILPTQPREDTGVSQKAVVRQRGAASTADFEVHQRLGLSYRWPAEEHLVRNAEDGEVRADTQGQAGDGRGREDGIAP